MRSDAERIHRTFVRTARDIAPSLAREFRMIGPLWFPAREDHGLGVFLCRSVIGQQLSTSAARSIWQRVVSATGRQGAEMTSFFRAENTEALRACGVSSNKIKALAAIRQAESTGHFDLRRLSSMTHAERVSHLSAVWGIGPWTCDMTSIFYFKETDVWPDGDASALRAASRFVAPRGATAKALARFAAEFSPYRSVLALYMWRILDGE